MAEGYFSFLKTEDFRICSLLWVAV